MPPLNYVLGREVEAGGDYVYNDPNTFTRMFLRSYWTRDENSPYFFSNANYLVRALLNKEHLLLQAKKNKDIIFTSYHSTKDELTPFEFKNSYIELLRHLGYEVDFKAVSEDKVDGKFIKHLEHGCGIPDKALFRKELPPMLEKLQGRKCVMKQNSIAYPCDDKIFIFKDTEAKFTLHITRRMRASQSKL